MNSPSVLQLKSPRQAEKLTGVGGWLLFFCIVLTAIFPLSLLGGTISGWQQLLPLFDRLPGLEGLLALDLLLNSSLSLAAVYAGVCLWRRKPNAVAIAQGFLTALWIARLVEFVLIIMSGTPGGRALIGSAFFSLLQTIVSVLIWKNYLKSSKRVQLTFGNPSVVFLNQPSAAAAAPLLPPAAKAAVAPTDSSSQPIA